MSDKVADRTVIVENPAQGEGAGVLVAAGDPLPAGVGLIENTPNKVDAASNHETADAADQAQNPTPAGPFPAVLPLADHGSEVARREAAREALERTSANRSAFEERQAELLGSEHVARDELETPAGTSTPPTEPARAETEEPTEKAPPAPKAGDMTVKELDAQYGSLEGYPARGNKAEKVEFIENEAS